MERFRTCPESFRTGHDPSGHVAERFISTPETFPTCREDFTSTPEHFISRREDFISTPEALLDWSRGGSFPLQPVFSTCSDRRNRVGVRKIAVGPFFAVAGGGGRRLCTVRASWEEEKASLCRCC